MRSRENSSGAIRLLISGGPGAGSTTTGTALSKRFGIPVFDSDDFFHKPTDPPFQEQYSVEERRELLTAAISRESSWILCGSISNWGLEDVQLTHGVFLDLPSDVRMPRLHRRQRMQFGDRIDPGGDLAEEHELFLHWAAEYGNRTGDGRNRQTDRAFVVEKASSFLEIEKVERLDEIVERISRFLTKTPHP